MSTFYFTNFPIKIYGNELKVGWQLSDGLSAPDVPLTLLPIAVVAVVAVVNQGSMRVLLLLLSLSTLNERKILQQK
uniref:Uncharacterized protein n=1 Tax=Glossina palpalis gambiensis TaxID=67801 RepID=A0A1B0BVL7_9MUSC